MKNTVDNLAYDVKTIDPNDPDLYKKLELLMNNMTKAFNKWLILGNNKVGKVDTITTKLESNIMLIYQHATDLLVFFSLAALNIGSEHAIVDAFDASAELAKVVEQCIDVAKLGVTERRDAVSLARHAGLGAQSGPLPWH